MLCLYLKCVLAVSVVRTIAPVEVRADRRQTLGIRWVVNYARLRGERTMKRTFGRRIDGRFQQCRRCNQEKRRYS